MKASTAKAITDSRQKLRTAGTARSDKYGYRPVKRKVERSTWAQRRLHRAPWLGDLVTVIMLLGVVWAVASI